MLAETVAIVATFCTVWNTGTVEDKNRFLMDRMPVIIQVMKKKDVPKGTIDLFSVCYEKNISNLREVLNRDCQIERALTDFFGAQVDTSNQEYEHITEYINVCTSPEGQEA